MRKDIIYISAIALITVMFMLDRCSTHKDMYEQSAELSSYEDTVKFYQANNGELIASNNAIKIDRDVLFDNNKELKKEVEILRIKKPEVIIKWRGGVRIDSIPVPFEVRLPCDTFTRIIKIDSTHYDINATLTDKALTFDGISFPNEQTIVIGDKRGKWYNPKEYTVAVKHSNPYVVTTGMQAYTITDKKKFYEKTWFKVAAGFAGGIIICKPIK